jgi:hypothetical protein
MFARSEPERSLFALTDMLGREPGAGDTRRVCANVDYVIFWQPRDCIDDKRQSDGRATR